MLGRTWNEYGGHWTRTDGWCDGWETGPSVWVKRGQYNELIDENIIKEAEV